MRFKSQGKFLIFNLQLFVYLAKELIKLIIPWEEVM